MYTNVDEWATFTLRLRITIGGVHAPLRTPSA